MRIGIDIRAIGSQRTGDETYTLQLVKSLEKLDRDNKYFLYTNIIDENKLENVREILSVKSINFKIIPISPTSKMFWTMYALPRQAKKDRLDVLHVQYIAPLLLSKKIKLITTIHDISFVRYSEFISKKDLLALKCLIKPSLARADKIIAVSKFTKDEIVKVYGIVSNKIKVVYNGGVADEFKEDIKKEEVLSFRTRHNILEPYLLFLGTLQPRKKIAFLIKSFIELKNKYENREDIKKLSLVIRGSRNGHNYDSRIDEVLKSAKKKYPDIYKQIKFIGYISNDEIPLIFKGALAFCFTSVYEGFGLPLLESMAVKTPVIASDDSCFPEVINGAGLIYKSGNSNDLVSKIQQLMGDKKLREKIINNGTERSKFFSWERNAQQTIKIYEELNKNKK